MGTKQSYVLIDGVWAAAGGPAGAASTVPGPAGPGVPAGGTTGQVLAKNSDTSLDTEWIDPPAGSSGVVISPEPPDPAGLPEGTIWIDEDSIIESVLPAGGTTDQVLAKASGSDYDVEWTSAYLKEIAPVADGSNSITTPATHRVGQWDISDDASDTATWPDRLQFRFQNGPGVFKRTGGFNEYGEIRSDSAKPTTVAARVSGHLNNSNVPDSTANILEVREGRGVGDMLMAVSRTNITVARPIVLPAAPAADLEAATKKYVDDNAGGGSGAALAAHIADDDPHTQYLKENSPVSDGSNVISDPTAQRVGQWDISDDATDATAWPDRLQFRFQQSGVYRRTGGFNEYGELRADAAKSSTVAARVHGHLHPTTFVPDSIGLIFEVREGRGVGDTLFGVSRTAVTAARAISAPNLVGGVVVLADGATVPAGTPAGTLIVRYNS